MDMILEERSRKELEMWENLAHENAFQPMGQFYWERFLIKEVYYNAKFGNYNRKW